MTHCPTAHPDAPVPCSLPLPLPPLSLLKVKVKVAGCGRFVTANYIGRLKMLCGALKSDNCERSCHSGPEASSV